MSEYINKLQQERVAEMERDLLGDNPYGFETTPNTVSSDPNEPVEAVAGYDDELLVELVGNKREVDPDPTEEDPTSQSLTDLHDGNGSAIDRLDELPNDGTSNMDTKPQGKPADPRISIMNFNEDQEGEDTTLPSEDNQSTGEEYVDPKRLVKVESKESVGEYIEQPGLGAKLKEKGSAVADFAAQEGAAQVIGGTIDALNNTLALGVDVAELFGAEIDSDGRVIPTVKGADTGVGSAVRGMTQFFVPFLGVMGKIQKGAKLAGAAGKILGSAPVAGTIAGAITGFVAMDPHQERLATMMNDVPGLGKIVPDYMADNNPANESVWEGRFKNAFEEMFVGALSEVFFKSFSQVIKAYKRARWAKKAGKTSVQADKEAAMSAVAKEDSLNASSSMMPDEPVEIADDVLAGGKKTGVKPDDVTAVKPDVDTDTAVKEIEVKVEDTKVKADEAQAKVDEAQAKADEAQAKVDEAQAKADELEQRSADADAADMDEIQAAKDEAKKQAKAAKAEAKTAKEQAKVIKAEADAAKEQAAKAADARVKADKQLASIRAKELKRKVATKTAAKGSPFEATDGFTVADKPPVDEELQGIASEIMGKTPEGNTYLNTNRINTEEDVERVLRNMADDIDNGKYKPKDVPRKQPEYDNPAFPDNTPEPKAPSKVDVDSNTRSAVDDAVPGRQADDVMRQADEAVTGSQIDEATGVKKAAANDIFNTRVTPDDFAADADAITAKGRDNKTRFNTTKTLKEMEFESQFEMNDLKDLLGRDPERPFTAAEAVAAREIYVSSGETLTELAKRVSLDPTLENKYAFRKALAIHEQIRDQVLTGRRATARSLKSWDISVSSQKVRHRQLQDLMRGAEYTDDMDMAKMISNLAENGADAETIAKAAGMGRGVARRSVDAFYTAWINGLLSGTATHVRNFVGNTLTATLAIPEGYAKAAFQGGRNGSIKAANARMVGAVRGIMDGISLMRNSDTFTGNLMKQAKYDTNTGALRANQLFKTDKDNWLTHGWDYLMKVIEFPGWALEKGDMFFKGIAYRMKVQEEAALALYKSGITNKTEAMKFVDDFIRTPPSDIMMDAVDFAKYQTFTDEGGSFVQALGKLKDSNKYTAEVGRWVVPFTRTPARIMAYSLADRTPLALMTRKYKDAILAGGPKAAEARGRVALGTMMLTAGGALTMGGFITGGGPNNPVRKKQMEADGWQEYSIRIGDRYISYANFEPYSTHLSMAADAIEVLMGVDDPDGEGNAADFITGLVLSQVGNLGNKSYLANTFDLMDIIISQDEKRLQYWGMNMLQQPVYSSLIRSSKRYIGGQESKDYNMSAEGFLHSWGQKLKDGIPGWGSDAPPRVDIWGQEMKHEGTLPGVVHMFNPSGLSDRENDPVNKYLLDNEIAVGKPSRNISIMGGSVKLKNDEYYFFAKMAGEIAKKKLDKLEKRGVLRRATPGPDGTGALIVGRVLSQARNQARLTTIKEYPELEDRVAKERKRIAAERQGQL